MLSGFRCFFTLFKHFVACLFLNIQFFPEVRPYRLDETDRSTLSGGLKQKSQNVVFFLYFVRYLHKVYSLSFFSRFFVKSAPRAQGPRAQAQALWPQGPKASPGPGPQEGDGDDGGSGGRISWPPPAPHPITPRDEISRSGKPLTPTM